MTFSNPMFFWAFLSLIPLIAVYFLKVRPRRKPTTAYFLWEQIFREKRSTSLLRRLRDFWSLLLMALAASAICFALTAPQWTDDDRKDALILIDQSASMSARDTGGSRMENAKKIAAEIVRAFNGNQRAAVATVGNDLIYRSHLTDNPRELLDVIEAIESSGQTLRADVLQSFENEDQWSKDYRVILITDGCFDREKLPERVELLKVGEPQDNVGIISADMQYLPGGERQLGFYFQVASTHKETVTVDLLVNRVGDTGTEELFKLISLEITPGTNEPQVFTLENAAPGRWKASLDVIDALASDNVAYLSVELPRPVRVAVQSDDHYFFENSVLAFSRGAGLLALSENNPHIVLSKSSSPEAENALIFKPEGDSPWWSDLGDEIDSVAPRQLIEDHPALRFVDATSMPFLGARRLKPVDGAQVLVASDDGVPLIYRASREGKSAFVVNMDPVAAEFYFSAWFPVLVHSAAVHLAGREETLAATYRPSDVATVPGVRENEKTKVVDPNGVVSEVQGKTLPPLEQLGFYQLNNRSGDWLVACSLLSQQETLLANEEVEQTSQPISRGAAPAQLLTVLAILVLTIESLLYHRRKVG